MAGEEPGAAGSTIAADLHSRFRDSIETLRTRADTTAKALLALGTTGLTAIGIAKFSDVFPRPPGTGGWLCVFLVPTSFLAMALIIVVFTLRLWKLAEPFVLSSNPDLMTDLRGDDERERVCTIYHRLAEANGVCSLAAYEARANRLLRIAARTSDTAEAARLTAEAEVMQTEVLATEAKAGLVIIRQRATDTLKGGRAKLMYLGFALALVVFGLSADWLDNARAGQIKVATDCGAAVGAGAKATPPICDQYLTPKKPEDQPEEPVPAAVIDKARTALAGALADCRAAARKKKRPVTVCAPLAQALKQTLG